MEFTDLGRRLVIKGYQERKQENMTHPLLEQNLRMFSEAMDRAKKLVNVGDILAR